MLPTIIRIGPIPIRGYGLMLAIGFMLAMYLAQKKASKFGFDPEKLSVLFPSIIIWAAIGARLFHTFIEMPSYYFHHPVDIFKFWDGGVTYYGGLIGGILTTYLFCKKHKVSMLKLADFLITYVALGQIFGRLGCTLAGCCHGIPCDLPWAYAITNPESVTRPLGVPLHPTQLYQATWNLFTFILLYRNAERSKFAGENLLLYGIVYPIGRSIIEIFRGDSVRGYIIDGVLTTSQGISLVVFIVCVSIYLRKHFSKNEN
ncbi:MAG: prolipoprotein diacylglyceryl transferase [Oligoflexia bacterium]|nr:prolipoprotein diacylglyceryl transferase [Oligoflexia bacterium]